MKYKVLSIASFDTNPTEISGQLREFLTALRLKRIPLPPFKKVPANALMADDDLTESEFYDNIRDYIISDAEGRKIRRRAERLAELRITNSAVGHLKKEEISRLRPLISHVQMIHVESEHRADEIAAKLHQEAPWMAPATEYVWQSLRRSAAYGQPVKIAPLVLNGPPGIGKSSWARQLAKVLQAPVADLDASKGGAGASIVGVERGWGTAQPGRPLETMMATNIGNPIMIVDEICKAKTLLSSQGVGYSFADSLLSMLEPATSISWECPYFRLPFNMSHVSWIMTANDVQKVPETILSRCQVIELRDLRPNELHGILDREGKRMQLSQIAVDVAHDALDASAALLGRRMTLRDIGRILMRAGDLEKRPLLH